MNTSMPHSRDSLAESKQSYNQLAANREQNTAALLSMLLIVVFGFLLFAPEYLPSGLVGIVLGVVPAIYMTAYLHRYPDSLRNRRGSLVTAIGLVAFLWLVAVASVAAILAGVVT